MSKLNVFSVFLSSTFQDMHVERDYLRKNAFRRLDAELMRRGARLRVLDLRGSVYDEEGYTQEEAVFFMCLNGVESCRPRIIGLLGDRYGWIPYGEMATYEDEIERIRIESAVNRIHENKKINLTKEEIRNKSITELEILFGFKYSDKNDSIETRKFDFKQDSFFFNRHIVGNKESVPEAYKKDSHLQDLLKETIVQVYQTDSSNHVFNYNADWDIEKNHIDEKSLREFDAAVYEHLSKSILNELETAKESSAENEIENYLAYKSEKSILRDEVKDIDAFIMDDENSILIVEGVAGSGKSTLLAQVFQTFERKRASGELNLITHIAGLNADSRDVLWMMQHYCSQIERQLGISPCDSDTQLKEDEESLYTTKARAQTDFNSLRGRLAQLIDEACKTKKLVLLLDSSDSLEQSEEVKYLCWLPERLPSNIRVILTTLPNYVVSEYRTDILTCTLNGVTDQQAKELLKGIAESVHGKGWDESVLAMVIEKFKKMGNLPLYGQIITNHLMSMSLKDFMRFEGEDRHIQWMKDEVNRSPMSIGELYDVLIERVISDYGRPLAEAVLGLIAVSRHGLEEHDLIEAVYHLEGIELTSMDILSIRGMLIGHLRLDMDQTWWDFEHQQLRLRLLERLDRDYQKRLHVCIIKAFVKGHGEKGYEDNYSNRIVYTNFYCREFLWHSFNAESITESIEWLNKLPNSPLKEALVEKTLIELLNDKNQNHIGTLLNMIQLITCEETRLYEFLLYQVREIQTSKFPFENLKSVLLELNAVAKRSNIFLNHISQYYEGIVSNLLGQYYSHEGKLVEAERWYLEAEELNRLLYESQQENPYYVYSYAVICNDLGSFYTRGGKRLDAERWHLKAERLHRRLYESKRDNIKYAGLYATTCHVLGRFYSKFGNLAEGERWYLEAERLMRFMYETQQGNPSYMSSYAGNCLYLGRLYRVGKNHGDAERWYLKAERLHRRLYESQRENPSYVNAYAYNCNDLGGFYREGGKSVEAKRWYLEAERLKRRLYESQRENPGYVSSYAVTCHELGSFYKEGGNRDAAERWYLEAEGLKRHLYESQREHPDYVSKYADICYALGSFYSEVGNRKEAERWYLEAEKLSRRLYESQRENPGYVSSYAVTCHALGSYYLEGGNRKAAERWYLEDERLSRRLYESQCEHVGYVSAYAFTCHELGCFYREGGNRKEAERWYLEAKSFNRRLYESQQKNPVYVSSYAASCYQLSHFYSEGGNREAAERWYKEVERLKSSLKE